MLLALGLLDNRSKAQFAELRCTGASFRDGMLRARNPPPREAPYHYLAPLIAFMRYIPSIMKAESHPAILPDEKPDPCPAIS